MEFKEHSLVMVEAKDFFLGKRLAFYLKRCEIHENSHEVYMVDPHINPRKACVHLDQGDTIEEAS